MIATTIKIEYNNFYLVKHATGVSTSVFHPPLV
jgi:hypothetical protein